MACGLCCDGVLFGQVPLSPSDQDPQLDALLPTATSDGQRHMAQPCRAFDGRCCTVYSARPTVCRSFQCKLLVRLESGTVMQPEALAIARSTRRLVQSIRRDLESRGIDIRKRSLLAAYRDVPHWPDVAALGTLCLSLRKLAWNLHEYFNEGAALLLSGRRPKAALRSMGDPADTAD
jgi:hypothetical protein